jgi:hypothetical protein
VWMLDNCICVLPLWIAIMHVLSSLRNSPGGRKAFKEIIVSEVNSDSGFWIVRE